jgi:4-amino-4-deoxy-L-arabinose transferase-like glycosyltransferase
MSLQDVFARTAPKAVYAAARSSARPAEWLLDALTDRERRERSILWVLAGYVVLWTLYALVSKASQDVHHDLAQLVAWSREPGFGYNHPPLAAWIVTAWFAVFPLADWSAYLLASVNVAVTLWICWRLFGEWLDPVKRVAALAMLTLVPLYTFHALVYNANSAMLPFWAAATLFSLRAYRMRSGGAAALAGAFLGAAMMVKYWSLFLIAGLALASLIDARRRAFWLSPAPWIAAAVALAVFAPHLIWLADGRSTSLDFVAWMVDHETKAGIGKSLAYFASAAFYISVPMLALVLMQPSRAAVRDVLWPESLDRRFALLVLALPLLLPAVLNAIVPFRLTAVWTMPNWTLLPVVLFASPLIPMSRAVAARILTAAVTVQLVVLVVSPAVALMSYAHAAGDPTRRNAALAREIDSIWRQATDKPMRLIGGQDEIVATLSFYLADRPVPLEHLHPQAISAGDRVRSVDEGTMFVCFATDKECLGDIAPFARPGILRREVTLSSSFLGLEGPPVRYLLMAVPPRS